MKRAMINTGTTTNVIEPEVYKTFTSKEIGVCICTTLNELMGVDKKTIRKAIRQALLSRHIIPINDKRNNLVFFEEEMRLAFRTRHDALGYFGLSQDDIDFFLNKPTGEKSQ